MGEQGSGRGRAHRTRLRARCARLLRVAWKIVIYLRCAVYAGLASVWNWTYEPVGFQCRHKPLPANNSGVKVLVYACAKTGTTQMNKALGNLYDANWKSSDADINIIAPLADEFWQDPKNGGGMFPWQRLASARAPAYLRGTRPLPSVQRKSLQDAEMMRNIPRAGEVLAERFSRCRVDTMTFDGLEHFFWPIYEVSPEAKIIMLNWRPYKERMRSFANFEGHMDSFYAAIGLVGAGTATHMLPYCAVVLPIMDALTGNRLLGWMSNGTSLSKISKFRSYFNTVWRQATMERRVILHRNAGLEHNFYSEEQYNSFWEEGKRRIPKERRLEFDMRTGTMKDLCNFLEIKDNPECDTGRLPHKTVDLSRGSVQEPQQYLILGPYWLFCHWVNYTVLFAVLGWPLRVVVATLCKVFPQREPALEAG